LGYTNIGTIQKSANKYAHSVTIVGNDGGDQSGFLFSDNYFEMMPGEEKIVKILGSKSNGEISVKAWYSSNTTSIKWQKN
jgi:beta-mannosidase